MRDLAGGPRAHKGLWIVRLPVVLVVGSALLVGVACAGGNPSRPRYLPESVPTSGAPRVEPCGPGDAHGTTDTGVSDDAVTLATIADVSGLRPDLFRSNWEAMDAFVAYCNSVGGVRGRRLDLLHLDSALFSQRAQVIRACDSAFALVGSAAAFDDAGVVSETDCGIPDVPAFIAEPRHERAPSVVQPLPNPQSTYLVGPARYLARRYPAASKRSGLLWVDVGVTATRAQRQRAAQEAIGYRFVDVGPLPAVGADFVGVADRLVSERIGYLTVQGSVSDLVGVQQALAARGYRPTVTDAGQLFYDPSYLRGAGAAAEGTYVLALTVPLDEASGNPELARYEQWLQITHPGALPTALGERGWSAGLLFASALRSQGSTLTRAGVLRALRAVHHWDGNGLHIATDPGRGLASGCFAYVQVQGGAFVRAYPQRGFACPSDAVYRLNRTPGQP